VEDRLRQAFVREQDLTARIDGLTKEKAAREQELTVRIDNLTKEKAAREQAIAAAQKDLTARIDGLTKEKTAREQELTARIDNLTKEKAVREQAMDAFQKELTALKAGKTGAEQAAVETGAKLASARKELADALAVSGKSLAKAKEESQNELAALRKGQEDKLAGLEKLWHSRLDAASRNWTEREKKLTADWEETRKGLELRLAALEKQLAAVPVRDPQPPPPAAGIAGKGPSSRTVGRIVDRLPDGQTLLIPFGVERRLRQGLKFDVYRPETDGRRFIGGIKVIRVLEGCSLAVATFGETEIPTCPVTGRAVLEPGAKFSPFAADAAGKAVRLKTAAGVGLPLEAPAVGDLLENPFYDPDRLLTFALDPNLQGKSAALDFIKTLGGAPRTGTEAARADFLVSPAAGNPVAGGPRRVTLEHLANYLDPELSAGK
jgi:hypothetical protein